MSIKLFLFEKLAKLSRSELCLNLTKQSVSQSAAFFSLLILALSAGGCQSDPVVKECPVGQVLNGTQCEPLSCTEGDSSKLCPDGFDCNNGKCEGRKACQVPTDCRSKVCRDGFCANPEWCTATSQCIEGDRCNPETRRCIPDPCEGKCNQGVCDLKSGKCKNSDTCDEINESLYCMKGSKCIEGKCLTHKEYDALNPCLSVGNGVLDPYSFECVDSPNCRTSFECTGTKYCEAGRCVPSKCSEVEPCPGGRGECEPSTGQCNNALHCKSHNDCLSGYFCVHNSGGGEQPATGECRKANELCSPACPGRQTCVTSLAEGEFTPTCSEPKDGCTTTLDCQGVRRCVKTDPKSTIGTCQDSAMITCTATNAGSETAPLPFDRQQHTICSAAEKNYFEIDLSTLQGDDVGIAVTIAHQDVGAGGLQVILLGNSVAGASLEKKETLANGKYTLVIPLPADFDRTKKLKVQVSGVDVTHGGVTYSIDARSSYSGEPAACNDAKIIHMGQTVEGDFAVGKRAMHDCVDRNGTFPDSVWRFHLDTTTHVSIVASGSPGGFLAPLLSLREDCLDSRMLDCKSGSVGGVAEIDRFLKAGDYTIVVSASDGEGGASSESHYYVTFNGEKVSCIPDESSCKEGTRNVKQVCKSDGLGFDEITCSNECNRSLGVCDDEYGADCRAPIEIPTSGNVTYTAKLDLAKAKPQIALQDRSSCFSRVNLRGNDYLYKMTLAPLQEFRATLSTMTSTNDDVYLYLVKENPCENSQLNECTAISLASRASIEYLNSSKTESETVYLVVDSDRETLSDLSDTWDLEVEFHTRICLANDTMCDGKLLKRCDQHGDNFETYITCSDRCEDVNGVYKCLINKGDSCSSPIVVEASNKGTPIGPLTFIEANNFATLQQACQGFSPSNNKDTEDYFFKYTADAAQDEIVTVTATAGGYADVWIWATDGCDASEQKKGGRCLEGVNATSEDSPEKLQLFVPKGETRYFIVEGFAYRNPERATVTVNIDSAPAGSCTPNTILGCHSTGLEYCNSIREKVSVACSCSFVQGIAQCDTATGDSCFDTDLVNKDGTEKSGRLPSATSKGMFGYHLSSTSMFDPKGTHGECYFSPIGGMDGADKIFRFHLLAGEYLTAKLNVSSDTYARIYFLENCLDVDSCVSGKVIGSQEIGYHATQEMDLYMILDSASQHDGSSGDEWSIDWKIDSSVECPPNTTRCDGNEMIVCSDTGMSQRIRCSDGCMYGACVAESSASSCASATNLSSSQGELVDYTAVWRPQETSSAEVTSMCAQSDGRDVFYQVDMKKDQWLYVSRSSGDLNDAGSIYLSSSCTALKDSCFASYEDFYGVSGPALLRYRAAQDGPVVIAFDELYSSTASSLRTLRIQVLNPECTASTPAKCSSDSVSYCRNGRMVSTDCKGGCSSAGAVAECVIKDGDSCFAAIPLTTATGKKSGETWENLSVWGELTYDNGPAAQLPMTISGACLFDRETKGVDKYYSIDLIKGDLLSVDLYSKESSSAVLYILSDCRSDLCSAGDSVTSDGHYRHLDFVADKTGTYMIVVRNADGLDSHSFDLTWTRKSKELQANDCVPFTSSCTSDNAISLCDSTGYNHVEGTCADKCQDGICLLTADKVTEMDQCRTALKVSSSSLFNIPVSRLTDANESVVSCTGNVSETLEGLDSFFHVTLKPYQTVRAFIQSPGEGAKYIYRFLDCEHIARTCLEGRKVEMPNKRADFAPIFEYTAKDSEESFYLGIDGLYDYETAPVKIAFEFHDKVDECVSGKFAQQCVNEKIMRYCNERGYMSYAQCSSGVCDGTDNICRSPNHDTCLEADERTISAGETLTINGDFAGKTNAYELSALNCTGVTTPGNDYVVALTVGSANTTLNFSLTGEVESLASGSHGQSDLALYLTHSCAFLATQCLAGVDAEGPVSEGSSVSAPEETLTYTTTSDNERIYVIVDSHWPRLESRFKLLIEAAN